ncbi:IS3 family transposase [Fictibacillus terranigra]|uniref:IS3 family transposase n=1 Tax=Fictibacillus terranigra TaxID=3058424 RepID=UPI003390213F
MEEKIAEARLWIEEGFSVKKTTESLEVHRSLFYYHEKTDQEELSPIKRGRPTPGYSLTIAGDKVSDLEIEEFLMEAIEGEKSAYGYRKLTHYLRTEKQLDINPKKVYRLCAGLDILMQKRKSGPLYPRRLAKQHIITGPNQLWQLDIKYGSIQKSGRFFFLASAIDVFDRCIVGYYRGSTCQARDVTKMLHEAFLRRQIHFSDEDDSMNLIIRTDNGPQFLSRSFGEFCHHHYVLHERIPPKSPDLNAFIESFHSVIERECYQEYNFDCFDEAYYRIDEYIDFYNKRRYHGSLNYMSPVQYHEWFKEHGCKEDMVVNL